ncbi:MAG: hypothetical protein ACYC6G_10525 [Desulfobaccales bacterium]
MAYAGERIPNLLIQEDATLGIKESNTNPGQNETTENIIVIGASFVDTQNLIMKQLFLISALIINITLSVYFECIQYKKTYLFLIEAGVPLICNLISYAITIPIIYYLLKLKASSTYKYIILYLHIILIITLTMFIIDSNLYAFAVGRTLTPLALLSFILVWPVRAIITKTNNLLTFENISLAFLIAVVFRVVDYLLHGPR